MSVNECFYPILTQNDLKFEIPSQIIVYGFKLTYIFDLGPKIYDFTVPVPSSIYVNSATFPSSVGMAPKFMIMFIIPNYGGWRNRIFEFLLKDCIFKARVFLLFFKIFGHFCK